jgi:hypothetical protein
LDTSAVTDVAVYSHRSNSQTIGDLPTELLFNVFGLVYDDLYNTGDLIDHGTSAVSLSGIANHRLSGING